jgi:adenine-specific DNA-methyltransferase
MSVVFHESSSPLNRRSGRELIREVDRLRAAAFLKCSDEQRSRLGQFPTPVGIARYMASLIGVTGTSIRLLDAGAGVGSLTTAFVASILERERVPIAVDVTAFEIDKGLAIHLKDAFGLCDMSCREAGIRFDGRIREDDFIIAATEMLQGGLFGKGRQDLFNCAILNPPYKKINADSEHRRLLRAVGVETSNLYTAFLGLAMLLLEPGGELVAITPRSFCNGPYFRPFRELLLREMSIRRVHVFESRTEAFSEDEVLQESIIIHAVKSRTAPARVWVSSSRGPNELPATREVPYDALVKPNDPQKFLHIVSDDEGRDAADLMARLTHTLHDIGLAVSTGRIVDFRSRSLLRSNPDTTTVPLIYPTHFHDGWVSWPKLGQKKPNACVANHESARWLIPAAVHVLVKRFSAKEERRRIVAAVFDPGRIPCEQVGFENHLNYYHMDGSGLPRALAKGLTAFLNSTIVDTYFRQFNGHTQVNATDLRALTYPSQGKLQHLGESIGDRFPDQGELDVLVATELIGDGEKNTANSASRAKEDRGSTGGAGESRPPARTTKRTIGSDASLLARFKAGDAVGAGE